MKLYNISEPGESKMPHENEVENVAIGIDLGTTNSLVAISYDSKPSIILDDTGGLIPSVVQDGDWEISSFKRLMGKNLEEVEVYNKFYEIKPVHGNNPALNLNGKYFTAVELSALILKKLKNKAEKAIGREVKKAVITVPAYFDDAARLATKDAANIAGLDVLRLINEPTAAAIAYGLDKEITGTYLVYDLGGGTFDVSLLKIDNSVFHVVATGGDAMLGGDDYDMEICKYLIDNYTKAKALALTKLKKIARYLKEQLSISDNAEIDGFQITYDKFAEITSHLTQKTIKIMHRMLVDIGYSEDEIQGIILVGGSTRMPVISNAIQKVFNIRILNDINPDEVVALGAAIQAESLLKGSNHLLLDVCPMSIGVEIMGGMVEKVIPRNTIIPASYTETYTTYQDGQTSMSFHIVQGEREMAEDNRSLAKFVLNGIPPMKAGVPRIHVKFMMDADGLLSVTAWEEVSGSRQSVEVAPSYGLPKEVIREMILDAIDHAEDDFYRRQVAEKKAEIAIIINQIRSVLDEIPDLQVEGLDRLFEITNNLDSYDNADNLLSVLEQCKKTAEFVAAKHLDIGLSNKIKGMKIKDLENSLNKGD